MSLKEYGCIGHWLQISCVIQLPDQSSRVVARYIIVRTARLQNFFIFETSFEFPRPMSAQFYQEEIYEPLALDSLRHLGCWPSNPILLLLMKRQQLAILIPINNAIVNHHLQIEIFQHCYQFSLVLLCHAKYTDLQQGILNSSLEIVIIPVYDF